MNSDEWDDEEDEFNDAADMQRQTCRWLDDDDDSEGDDDCLGCGYCGWCIERSIDAVDDCRAQGGR